MEEASFMMPPLNNMSTKSDQLHGLRLVRSADMKNIQGNARGRDKDPPTIPSHEQIRLG